jgi:DNA-binding MarR family transcriptional regulator
VARDTVADRIAGRMFRITDAAVRETDSRLRRLAITVPQMRVLLALPPGTSLPQKDLARELGCDVSNITGVVDRLEQKKLVTRSGHDNDRRVKLVEATAEGLRLQRRLRTVRAAVARRLYGSLTRREQRALLELVGRLSE